MCFSAYAQYAQRPVKVNGDATPPVSVASALATDPNIFGMLAPDAQDAAHHHEPASAHPSAPAGPATVESVIVSLPDGRRLLITPLD